MSSYHINDLDNYPRTYSFLPNQEKDENGENLMTQSLVVQAPYRRILHPELTPVILNRDREERNYDIMSQSLIVPPYRRVRHAELTPALPKDQKQSSYKSHSDVKYKYQPSSSINVKAPKRAFSMTRLDQLARPRQRYLEEALKLRASKTKENLCFSAVRPTSSMSLVGKQQSPSSSNESKCSPSANTTNFTVLQNSANNHANTNNHGGTMLLRQRTSARKQRPISYAGYSYSACTSNTQNTLTTSNQDTSSNTTFSRASAKSKLAFGSVINSSSRTGSSSATTPTLNGAHHRNLMTSSMGDSMLSSLSKPTPPRKPSHIKAAAAARKANKQQQQEHQAESDRIKRSESSPRIRSHLEDSGNKITFANTISGKESTMKKSTTNPEKIAELLDEKLDMNDDEKAVQSDEKSALPEKSNDKLLLVDSEPTHTAEQRQAIDDEDASSEKLNEFDHMSTRTFVVDEEDKSSSNQACQPMLHAEASSDADKLSTANEDETIKSRPTEEEEQEKRRLENEEMKRRVQEEEKKRELERKVKERAEKARLEMEEKLRRDEQERNERKKRLDAIMSRTRKNPTKSNSPNTETNQQQIGRTTPPTEQHSKHDTGIEKQQNPDVVEEAIKSNLIKLTKSENLNNGKNELHNYIESETIIENKNIGLLNGFKEMKMSQNSTFVYATQSSNETTTFAPRAN